MFRLAGNVSSRGRERWTGSSSRYARFPIHPFPSTTVAAPLVLIDQAILISWGGQRWRADLTMDRVGAQVLSGLKVSFRDSLSRLTDTNGVRQTQTGARNFKTAPNKTLVLATNAVPSTSASPSLPGLQMPGSRQRLQCAGA
jgi:hypothetical protein